MAVEGVSPDLDSLLTFGQKVVLGRTRGNVHRVYRFEDSVIVVTCEQPRDEPIYAVTVPSGQQFPWAEIV